MVTFLEAMRREPGLVASDVMLAVTTLAFDIAGLEYWLPLSVGAHVIIASRTDVLMATSLIRPDGASMRNRLAGHAGDVAIDAGGRLDGQSRG